MTDEEQLIITTVWNDLVLREKLENNPYSLSHSELTSLKNNDYLNEWINTPCGFFHWPTYNQYTQDEIYPLYKMDHHHYLCHFLYNLLLSNCM